jgi:hypothetical protein
LRSEGTNSAAPQRLAGQAWARERGLSEYQHVLHPRVKGFETVVAAMPEASLLYDLTIIHTSDSERVQLGPGHLLRGIAPTTIFVRVKVSTCECVGVLQSLLSKWLVGLVAE